MAFAIAFTAPAGAQAPPRPVRGDTANFIVKILRSGDDVTILAKFDSLRRALDREPLNSADREKILFQIDQLLKPWIEKVQFHAEVARTFGGAGGRASGAARAMVERQQVQGCRLASPGGWIGINAEAPFACRTADGTTYIRYFDYPHIVSVEPGSPAQRAGISAGDVLVAYDRVDVRDHEINLSQLLVPERRVSVTARRERDTKEYEMTVAKAPDRFIKRLDVMRDTSDGTLRMWVGWPEARYGAMPVSPGTRGGNGGGMITQAIPAAPAMLWGAQFTTISEKLGRVLGVGSGILVTSVFPATPADASGLEDGDIIIKAGGRPVTDLRELRKITFEHDGEHAVELEVLRVNKASNVKKPTTITLRWGM